MFSFAHTLDFNVFFTYIYQGHPRPLLLHIMLFLCTSILDIAAVLGFYFPTGINKKFNSFHKKSLHPMDLMTSSYTMPVYHRRSHTIVLQHGEAASS